MLEQYLKRLEDIIVPHNYNKNNFREKIKAEFEDPSEIEEKKKKKEIVSSHAVNADLMSNLQSEEEKKLLDDYIQKMGLEEKNEKSLKDSKLKLYQKILENEGNADEKDLQANMMSSYYTNEGDNVQRPVSQSSKSNKTYSLSPSRRLKKDDEGLLRDKVHMLNIKAMNYRHEIELLKNTIANLNSKVEEQKIQIGKMEKQKETDNKYLIKLENLVSTTKEGLNFSSSPNKSKLNSDKTIITAFQSRSDNLVVDFNKSNNLIIEDKVNNTQLNISDKNELKEFIANLIVENQKLKAFQNGVFDLSKKYDDVNENMVDGMKQIGQVLNLPGREGGLTNAQQMDEASKKDIISNFEKLVENVERTLEIKQSEYNFLLEAKDQENKFMSEEILKLKEAAESTKRDRIRDQKIINDYESEIHFLTSRMDENLGKASESLQKDENSILKLQKKINPAKTTVNKIVKKLERTFDLQDKSNVKMISNITRNIK